MIVLNANGEIIEQTHPINPLYAGVVQGLTAAEILFGAADGAVEQDSGLLYYPTASPAVPMLVLNGSDPVMVIGHSDEIDQSGARLQVIWSGGAAGQNSISYNDTAASGSFFSGWRARGTVGSEAAVQSGDSLVRLQGVGNNGDAANDGWAAVQARFGAYAAETFTLTETGTYWVLEVTEPLTTTLTPIATFSFDVIDLQSGGVTVGGTLTLEAATETRLLYVGASNIVTDAAGMTYDGTSLSLAAALKLNASSNQIVFDADGAAPGTLTWTPTSSAKTITLPDATGTVPLGTGTATNLAGWTGTNSLEAVAILTYNSTALFITANTSGASVGYKLTNTSNTAASNALAWLVAGGDSGGDAKIRLDTETSFPTTNWAFGLDNSDSDAMVWSLSSDLGTNNRMRLDTVGQLSLPVTGSTGGVLIGGDAQLYRSAADTLRTPDALTVDGDLTAANVLSGTYTPTLTGVANIAATGALTCQYIRVGNVVTVSGAMTIDPTSAGSTTTELGISLPIASDFTAGEQCGGVAINGLSNNQTAAIDADATNNRARMRWLSLDAANRTWAFTFTYQIR